MKNVLNSLAKSVLIPLGLTTAASATDAAIQNKMFGSGRPSDLNDIMKILKWLEESGLLIKGVSETTENEAKNKNEEFSVCY